MSNRDLIRYVGNDSSSFNLIGFKTSDQQMRKDDLSLIPGYHHLETSPLKDGSYLHLYTRSLPVNDSEVAEFRERCIRESSSDAPRVEAPTAYVPLPTNPVDFPWSCPAEEEDNPRGRPEEDTFCFG